MLDRVTIRPILPDELEKVARLRAIGFDRDEKEILKKIQNNSRYNFSHIILAEYSGEPVGTTTVFPAQMWLSGVPLDVGAVASVTVLPEFRRNGIAAKMMEFAIMRMFAEGRALSALFPFLHKYYSRFGYGVIGNVHAYRFHTANLTVFEEGHRVRPFQPDDLPMMRVMYKGQLTWHNGWFTRSNARWDDIIAHYPHIMVYEHDDMIEGYYSYELKEDQRGQSELHIKEFFAGDDAAYRGLIGYLAAQNEAEIIEYLAPPDTLFQYALRQPWADEGQNRGWIFNDLCHVTPGLMGRIINLPTALTSRFYTRGKSGERVLQVTDPLIPANEEPLVFRVVDGRAETRPAEGADPQIRLDIGTLSQILCGYIKAIDARRIGLLQASEDTCSWLDQVIVDTPLYVQAGDWF